MASLYEIATQYKAELELLESLELDEQTFSDTLESIDGDIDSKLEAVISFMLNLGAVSKSKKDAADVKIKAANKLLEQAKKIDENTKCINGYVHEFMLSCAKEEFETPNFRAYIKSMPDTIDKLDKSKIPIGFMRIKPAPDPEPMLNEIKKHINDNGPVPWATMLTGRTKLVVK